MKKASISALLSFIVVMACLAQTKKIVYSYDNAGNRIGRIAIELQQQAAPAAKATIDPITSETGSESKLVIYPNPTQGLLRVHLEGHDPDVSVQVRVFTNTGTPVLSQEHHGTELEVDLYSQPNGIYFLDLVVNGNQRHHFTIIKE